MALYFGNAAAITLLLTSGAADAGPPKTSVVEQVFGEVTTNFAHDLPVSLLPAVARRLRWNVDLVQRRIEVLVDGASALAVPLELPFVLPNTVTALVGVVYANPAAPLTVRVRNVSLDVKLLAGRTPRGRRRRPAQRRW